MLKFVGALREGKLRLPRFSSEQPASDQSTARFGGFAIAGGAPGINAVLDANEANGYTIIVMSNYDPPSAQKIAKEIRGLISRLKK